MDTMVTTNDTKQRIMDAARLTVQAHGYGGLSFRDLAKEVGIKSASVHHHFPTKADLAAAIAKRYWEDTESGLAALSAEIGDPLRSLHEYPGIFRKSLENDNRLCMSSFLAAESEDLPESVKTEVRTFADVNVAWLARHLTEAKIVRPEGSEARARAIYAAVAGAQLMARSRSDVSLYDSLIEGYRAAGLLPA